MKVTFIGGNFDPQPEELWFFAGSQAPHHLRFNEPKELPDHAIETLKRTLTPAEARQFRFE